jgi:hypothetical protein
MAAPAFEGDDLPRDALGPSLHAATDSGNTRYLSKSLRSCANLDGTEFGRDRKFLASIACLSLMGSFLNSSRLVFDYCVVALLDLDFYPQHR